MAKRPFLLLVVAAIGLSGAVTAAPVLADETATVHGHSHGKRIFPTQASAQAQRKQASRHPTGSALLRYGGGVDNIGVTIGKEKVYLVFWGSQWGSSSPDGNGNITLGGDPKGVAVRLQQLFKGLGTNNELWSGVTTQYCEGIAAGSTSCPANAPHVAYPTGGALAGVWVDDSAAAPSAASEHALAVKAVDAAGHFGNTTKELNRNAQYVVVSPTGTNPDNYKTNGFCAWHDWNGDTSLIGGAAASPYGDIAFTNLPYIPDAGASCGANYVNSGTSGALDGVTIVEGHEYSETTSDQNPAGGWTDIQGYENADKCAWIGTGGLGGAQDVAMATGSFAMQGTYSNDVSACRIAHTIVGGGGTGNTVTVTNPGNQTSVQDSAASLQIHATDSGNAALTYSATGLPTGLSINATSGLISGTPTETGTSNVSVTATDTTDASGSASFTWTVNPSGGTCTATNVVGNPGFETGTAAPWTASAGVINGLSTEPAHSGRWDAWLDGDGTTHTDTLSQSLTVPAGCSSYLLSFWLHIDTRETSKKASDKLTVKVGSATLATYSNANKNTGYAQKTFNAASYAGQAITLTFTGTENSSRQTSFVIDDAALNVS